MSINKPFKVNYHISESKSPQTKSTITKT